MSTRFDSADSSEIWVHLNALDDGVVHHFASTGARDAAITGPTAGMVAAIGTGAALVLTMYDGTDWVPLPWTDTGWVALTLNAGFTGNAHYREKNGDILLRLGFNSTAPVAAGAAVSPATMPAGTFPPASNYAALAAIGTGTFPAAASVHPTTGVVTIRNLHTASLSTFYVTGQWSKS